MSESNQLKINDYQIHLPALGEGTYGKVYRATYRSLSDRALKVFRPGAVDIVTMARELEKLSKVAEHSGIVTLHDFDLLNEPPYYAMGLHADTAPDGSWETRTLERLCGHVDYKEAWRLIRDIADAVAYLHRHQIVHCDLKPSNILLTDETPHNIKICDFGQSRGLAAETFEPVGTPLYASPEQLRSPSDSSDGRGYRWDVYSFGVVAYKLLTGDLPRLQQLADAEKTSLDMEATINEASLEATLADTGQKLDGQNLANMVEAVDEITWPDNYYIPTSRKLLIEECLSLDPAQRPADMREVRRRIQERDHMRAVRRARRVNIVFAVLLVAALWAGTFAFIQAGRAQKATEEAMVSSKQAQDLALIIVDEISSMTKGELSGQGATKLYSIVAENSETFLDNLPKTNQSETTLRLSAQTASMRGRQAYNLAANTKQQDEALPYYQEALNKFTNAYEIRSELGGDQLDRLATKDLMQIGLIQERLGRIQDAVDSFDQVRERRLAHFADTDNASRQQIREITTVYQALADLYAKTDQGKLAISTLDEIANLLTDAIKDASSDQLRAYQQALMPMLARMGEVQIAEKEPRGAYVTYEDLASIADQVRSGSPTDNDEARNYFLTATHQLGLIQLDRGDTEAAEQLFREEIRIRQKTARLRPYDPDLKIGLAAAYQKASACLDLSDLTSRNLGEYYLEQALALLSSLPPDLRNTDTNTTQAALYQAQLDALREMEE